MVLKIVQISISNIWNVYLIIVNSDGMCLKRITFRTCSVFCFFSSSILHSPTSYILHYYIHPTFSGSNKWKSIRTRTLNYGRKYMVELLIKTPYIKSLLLLRKSYVTQRRAETTSPFRLLSWKRGIGSSGSLALSPINRFSSTNMISV